MEDEQKRKKDLESAKVWLAIAKEKGNNLAVQIVEHLFPELRESEDEKIRKEIIEYLRFKYEDSNAIKHDYDKWISWLEKQGEKKPNPYSGVSFEYNGNIWGMCVRDNGVDILCDSQLIKHIEKQGEQKSSWSEEDELMLTSIIQTLKLTNGAAQMKIDWLKSIKPRWKPTEEQIEMESSNFYNRYDSDELYSRY